MQRMHKRCNLISTSVFFIFAVASSHCISELCVHARSLSVSDDDRYQFEQIKIGQPSILDLMLALLQFCRLPTHFLRLLFPFSCAFYFDFIIFQNLIVCRREVKMKIRRTL